MIPFAQESGWLVIHRKWRPKLMQIKCPDEHAMKSCDRHDRMKSNPESAEMNNFVDFHCKFVVAVDFNLQKTDNHSFCISLSVYLLHSMTATCLNKHCVCQTGKVNFILLTSNFVQMNTNIWIPGNVQTCSPLHCISILLAFCNLRHVNCKATWWDLFV